MRNNDEGQGMRAVLFAPVPPELHRAARIRAIEEGRAVARLVEDAVRHYLKESPSESATGRHEEAP